MMIPISESLAPISYVSPNLTISAVCWLSSPWAPQRQHIQDGIISPLTSLLYLLNAQFHLTVLTLPVAQNCNNRIILTSPFTLNILSFQSYQSLKMQQSHLYHMSISYHPYRHYLIWTTTFLGYANGPLNDIPASISLDAILLIQL